MQHRYKDVTLPESLRAKFEKLLTHHGFCIHWVRDLQCATISNPRARAQWTDQPETIRASDNGSFLWLVSVGVDMLVYHCPGIPPVKR